MEMMVGKSIDTKKTREKVRKIGKMEVGMENKRMVKRER